MNKIKEIVSENLSVEVTPDEKHEFLMTTSEVAKGYGVASNTVRMHKSEHKDELIEGKHFLIVGNNKMNGFNSANHAVSKTDADCLSDSYPFKTVLWTKRGIVRLGFFIKSERARMFRDWAEDLVIGKVEEAQRIVQQSRQLSLWPEPHKRNHNRLTKERLVDILADIARIEDKELRLSLVNKLTHIKA